MLARLSYLRERLDTSIWLIPIGLCLLSALLGILMLWFYRCLGSREFGLAPLAMPLVAAREILGVIAGSIISVGGVAFSVTMVALTLTSGQYGPKILRNFLEEASSKITLGLFLGTYVCALIVLTGYTQADRPRFTVIVSLLLAFSALFAFVGFIHRAATDLQADKIIHRIGGQLERALKELAAGARLTGRISATLTWRRAARSHRSYPIAALGGGYVQAIDYGGLVAWCVENDCLLQVRARAGDFLVAGVCLFRVFACNDERLGDVVKDLNSHVVLGPIRTPTQDPEYAITQLNQLVARALSPGINDPGTAITCVDWFSLSLAQIVDQDLPGCIFLDQDQRPRLLARASSFAGIMKAIYTPLREFINTDSAVVVRLLESLCRLAELTRRADRLSILAMRGEHIWDQVHRQPVSDNDLRDIRRGYLKLRSLLGGERVQPF
jgi:uncharacterized membrane protein